MKLSFWDALSILFITATILLIAVVAIIFFDPESPINPFPYPTMPATISVPSLTPTKVFLPPTWTPTPKIVSTPNP